MKEKVVKIFINTEYLQLQQLLKKADLISSGGEAKIFLAENEVLVDGTPDNRRGRKLYPGSIIKIKDQIYEIVSR